MNKKYVICLLLAFFLVSVCAHAEPELACSTKLELKTANGYILKQYQDRSLGIFILVDGELPNIVDYNIVINKYINSTLEATQLFARFRLFASSRTMQGSVGSYHEASEPNPERIGSFRLTLTCSSSPLVESSSAPVAGNSLGEGRRRTREGDDSSSVATSASAGNASPSAGTASPATPGNSNYDGGNAAASSSKKPRSGGAGSGASSRLSGGGSALFTHSPVEAISIPSSPAASSSAAAAAGTRASSAGPVRQSPSFSRAFMMPDSAARSVATPSESAVLLPEALNLSPRYPVVASISAAVTTQADSGASFLPSNQRAAEQGQEVPAVPYFSSAAAPAPGAAVAQTRFAATSLASQASPHVPLSNSSRYVGNHGISPFIGTYVSSPSQNPQVTNNRMSIQERDFGLGQKCYHLTIPFGGTATTYVLLPNKVVARQNPNHGSPIWVDEGHWNLGSRPMHSNSQSELWIQLKLRTRNPTIEVLYYITGEIDESGRIHEVENTYVESDIATRASRSGWYDGGSFTKQVGSQILPGPVAIAPQLSPTSSIAAAASSSPVAAFPSPVAGSVSSAAASPSLATPPAISAGLNNAGQDLSAVAAGDAFSDSFLISELQ